MFVEVVSEKIKSINDLVHQFYWVEEKMRVYALPSEKY